MSQAKRDLELIITVPNDRNSQTFNAGRAAGEHLQNPSQALQDLGVIPVAELVTNMNRHHVPDASLMDRLPFAYHLVAVPDGDLSGAAARILRWHNDPTASRPGHGYVERIEENRALTPAAPTVDLGSGFSFTKQHDAYLTMLGLDPAARPKTNDGQGVVVAVIDSGVEPGASVNRKGYIDVIDKLSTGPEDASGHGTAMAEIIHAVAPLAEIHVIRAFDRRYALLFDVMAGIGAAYYGVKAQIINCSLGFKDLLSRCSICGGAGGGRSKTFEDYLKALENSRSTLMPAPPQPVIVAAVGNDYSPSNPADFRAPARYDPTVAVGAVTSGYTLSPFSNRGTAKNRYFLLPGGDDTLTSGAPTEAIGTASGGTTYCIGTSGAAAYATGLLALYRGESRYQPLSTDDFLDAMASQCVVSSIKPYSSVDHGKGFFKFH
jgi:hypothetical protein